MTLDDIDEIWSVDFEFVARPGEIYDPVCLTAVELIGGRVIRLWRDEMGRVPPYGIGSRKPYAPPRASAASKRGNRR